jgi:hypothetical protein
VSVAALLAVHKLAVSTSRACYRVLMCLAERADDNGGNAWPSIDSIATEAQANEKTVRRSLSKLEAVGLIVGERGRGRRNTTVWSLNFPITRLIREGVAPGLERTEEGILSAKPGIASPEPVLNQSITTARLLALPEQVQPLPSDRTAEMVTVWNTTCGDKLPRAQAHMLLDRRRALRTVLAREMGSSIEAWQRFCQRVRAAPHLTGENNRDWRASLDWCLKPANAIKIIEGKYDRSAAPREPGKSYAGCL